MFRKSIVFTLLLIIVIVIAFIVTIVCMSYTGNIISIKNNTGKTLSDLKITYSNSSDEIKVSPILPNETFKTKYSLPHNFLEGSIKMLYIDNNGISHEECIVGYIEKGNKENIIITVESIDDKGILSMNIRIKKGLLQL